MNIFEDCESTKHVAIWYQKVSLHDKEFDLVTSLYRNEDEKISMKKPYQFSVVISENQ